MSDDRHWAPDPVQGRPIPDRSLRVRAQRDMVKHETELERYVRQQWQATMAGVRVALDAWRRIWPFEHDAFTADRARVLASIEATLADLYQQLDSFSEEMQGQLVDRVEHFDITTHEQLDRQLPEEERRGQPDEA